MENIMAILLDRWGESRRWFDLDEYYLWAYCNGNILYAIKSNKDGNDNEPPYLDVFKSHREAINYIYYYLNQEKPYYPELTLKLVDVVINPRPKDHRVGNRFMPYNGISEKHIIEYRVFSPNNIRANVFPFNLQEAIDVLKSTNGGYILICENDQVEGVLEYGWLATHYGWNINNSKKGT